VDAAGDEIAIKAHVVDLADGDHDRARLAHLGERVDVVQRIAAFRQVDHQHIGAGVIESDCTALRRPPLLHFSDLPAHLDRDRADDVGAAVIAGYRPGTFPGPRPCPS
jgi:hypothetical protein